MAETLQLLLTFGYETMGLNRIEALVDPRNDNSRRLLQKLGFVEEGLLREYQRSESGFVDLMIYSLLKKEYGPEVNREKRSN
ncbi:putative ribosomal N-acetyltransferase YdaF [compost metagenome]